MKTFASILILLSNTATAVLADEVKCHVKQGDYSVELHLDENHKTTIKYTFHEGKKKSVYMCDARVVKNRNETEGVVPKLIYGFKLEKCSPDLSVDLNTELIEEPNLIVRLLRAESGYSGLFQWHNKYQPNDCLIRRFDVVKFTKHKDKF